GTAERREIEHGELDPRRPDRSARVTWVSKGRQHSGVEGVRLSLQHLAGKLEEHEHQDARGQADQEPGELLSLELAPPGPTTDGNGHGFGIRSVALTMA